MNTINKTKKSFQFQYELKHKVVRDLKIVTESIGFLEVIGVGYFNKNASPIDVFDRYSIDIEFINWNGNDIKPVFELMGDIEAIEDAAIRHFATLVDNTKIAA